MVDVFHAARRFRICWYWLGSGLAWAALRLRSVQNASGASSPTSVGSAATRTSSTVTQIWVTGPRGPCATDEVAGQPRACIESAPLAIADLRRRGEEQIASLFEIFLGGTLLGAGRLEEAEAHVIALTERFRAEGPPTFLNWTLYMQGSFEAFGGNHERAQELYEESAAVRVPVRTNSPNEVLEARSAFRRGQHMRAFQILRSYVDELLEVDNMSGANLVHIEFINMMMTIDRLHDAAHVLGHVDTTGLLDVDGPGFKTLLADAVVKVASNPVATAVRKEAAALNHGERHALTYIRDVMEQLLERQRA